MAPLEFPPSSIREFVERLAREHGTVYVKTACDEWADAITRMSDDGVELDKIELLIIQLERDGVIDGD